MEIRSPRYLNDKKIPLKIMRILRRKSKVVKIGNVYIGGDNPVVIQSMTKTRTADVKETVKQIIKLQKIGCEIVRLAIRDFKDARAIKKIRPRVGIPLVADIHFDWRLALEAIDSGVDKIRLNPGNIYRKNQIREVVKAARLNGIPIRVGVNSGSLRSRQGHQSHQSQADTMVKSALDYIKILEGLKFHDIVISLKGSDIFDTIEAYRQIATRCDYPMHLGVTATGAPYMGTIKSSIGLGVLLLEGIGDTVRVSLTDRPQEEVRAARAILAALGLRNFGPEIISCPTCGRCEVDLVKIVKDLETKLSTIPATKSGWSAKHFGGDYRLSTRPPKVAVMGCVVNGPGEARGADVGVAFGRKEGLLFKNALPLRKVSLNNCINYLLKEGNLNV